MAAAAGWDPKLALAINLSAVQFRSGTLADELLALAEHHRLPPERLELEVTDAALTTRRDEVFATLRRLQAAGVRVVLDDFGTGAASLGYLRDFAFDKLKVDRSFVAGMLSDTSSASIVRAAVGLGRSLGMPVVAEGVETDAQIALLRVWGCDQVQGYWIGRPTSVPAAHALPTPRLAAARG